MVSHLRSSFTTPDPSRRAVAFTNTVNQSLEFAHYFPQVVEEVEKTGDKSLSCHVEHVDGAMNAQKRSMALDWLRDGEADDHCNVVSNARCLTEGVDVPALDAILFLYPRRSVIDVVQAVGRVMRKAEGRDSATSYSPLPGNLERHLKKPSMTASTSTSGKCSTRSSPTTTDSKPRSTTWL